MHERQRSLLHHTALRAATREWRRSGARTAVRARACRLSALYPDTAPFCVSSCPTMQYCAGKGVKTGVYYSNFV